MKYNINIENKEQLLNSIARHDFFNSAIFLSRDAVILSTILVDKLVRNQTIEIEISDSELVYKGKITTEINELFKILKTESKETIHNQYKKAYLNTTNSADLYKAADIIAAHTADTFNDSEHFIIVFKKTH